MPDSNMSFPGIIDYVAVHGSKTLEEVPLSAVDGLVFPQCLTFTLTA